MWRQTGNVHNRFRNFWRKQRNNTNKQTNETNKQNNQTNKWNKQTNKQMKRTKHNVLTLLFPPGMKNKQTNKQTNTRTNKPTKDSRELVRLLVQFKVLYALQLSSAIGFRFRQIYRMHDLWADVRSLVGVGFLCCSGMAWGPVRENGRTHYSLGNARSQSS